MFAHRGGAKGRRENTIPAFTKALSNGATGLETDVRLTADEVPVLFHDASLRRFGVLPRPIAQLNRANLPTRVPTLMDLYTACGTTVPLSTDLKDPRAFAPVVDAALAAGGSDALDNLVLCDGDLDQLERWKAADPRPTLCYSADAPAKNGAEAAAELRAIADAGVSVVNYRAKNWTPELINTAHEAGLLAFAWDANRRAPLARVVRGGIDGLYADNVAQMVASVRAALPT